MTKVECNCSVCRRHRRIEAVKAARDVDALIALVDELHNTLGDTEEDLDYRLCILNGSWPSAVEQLERALVTAKAFSVKPRR